MMITANTQVFFTEKNFLLRMAVVVVLALSTFLFFHYAGFSHGGSENWFINSVIHTNRYVYGLMALWSIVTIWVFYPLLVSWRGRFVVLSGGAMLFLVLMPFSYETQILKQLGTTLGQTPLPKSWLGVIPLSTAGHFLTFFGLSVITLHLFRRHFVGVFVLLLGVASLSELLQNFAIGRNANMGDFMVDSIGVLVAGCLVRLFARCKV